MATLAAFLRAINVGGRTVTMQRLRDIIAPLDVDDVRTFIASGNIVFDASARSAKRLETSIESALHDALGYEVDTFVRPMSALREIAKYEPASASHGKPDARTSVYVGFVRAAPTAAVARALAAHANAIDSFDVDGREIYWQSTRGVSGSTMTNARLEKLIGAPATFRNINTVRRLVQKFG
ncbi:MAG: DUF1697 domain-containing protein [Phycisphaerales bacterium]|nr:DUF1697 domain-containing protein [Phycisphaerales bacterium]